MKKRKNENQQQIMKLLHFKCLNHSYRIVHISDEVANKFKFSWMDKDACTFELSDRYLVVLYAKHLHDF